MAAIDICGITKNFGRTEVLKRVDLDIRDGEFLTLVGPSGCGKSTLLRIIAGLESQTGGEIRIAGAAVDHLRARDRDLAMVFQSYALYPHLTVAENIAVPLNMRRLNAARRLPLLGPLLPGTRRITAGIRAEVMATAAMLGIGHLLARRPGQLSGGQRQRVALGRAMVRHPRAFLMDEPLSNLDAKMRVHMRAEIARLHRRLGTTFIYVTHDQAEAMTMSDRLAVMMEGRILQLDTPDAVYDDPADIRVAEFIGSPRINLVTTRLAPSGRLLLGDRLLALRPATPGITPGAEIRLGFRPEHADLVPADRAALRGRVSLLENLGSDLLVHLELDDAAGGGTAVVRLDPARGRPAEGEICGIALGPKPLAFGADGARLPLAAAPAAEMAHV
ncbi:ABC transporter ATP-binding protein (plasmid) [Tistrella mobilis]|uniref:ABC transporter ATP-binding protein n=1 Tax=Tistrella mobilis TaxID=171437 RepID=UPI0035575D7E